MNKEEYIEILKNPNTWFGYAFEQKYVADKILVDIILNKNFVRNLKKKNDFTEFSALWKNALYHYGIGIENGLKGMIVKNQPELISFDIDDDDVILHDIGGKASKNHDLYSLANRAGLLKKELNLFKNDFDRKLIKNVLKQLSDAVRWAARYPVPSSSSKVFKMDDDVPHVSVYGFHIMDVICPLFNYFRSLQELKSEMNVDYLEEYFKIRERERKKREE